MTLAAALGCAAKAKLVILTAYFDESGIHDGSPVNILGGLAVTPEQHASLEQEWRALLGADPRPVRGKWLYHGEKRFKGLDHATRSVFAHSAAAIITRNISFSVSAVLPSADYDGVYRVADSGRQLPFDSKYGVMFRMVLSFLIAVGLQMDAGDRENEIHIVLESGTCANTAQAIYDRFTREAQPIASAAIKSVSIVDKKQSGAIQAADLHSYLVHRAYRDNREEIRSMLSWGPTRAPELARFQRFERAAYYELTASRDVLAEFRNALLLTRAERLATERSVNYQALGDEGFSS